LSINLNLYTKEVFKEVFKLSNLLILRSSARNSIVTFNALQKVFRARFEEGRAHTSLDQLSELSIKQAFLTGLRTSYEVLLAKTKNNFFNTTSYNIDIISIINQFSSITSLLNYHFFTFPFLLSIKSDMARYMWFD